jgi:integrase
MPRPRRRTPARKRIGRVSYYLHHGSWFLYYREGDRQVRRRVAETEGDAARIAAQVNSQLATTEPTLLAFEPLGVGELRRRFLDDHEQVRRSSLATLARYRAATRYLEEYAATLAPSTMAHQVRPDRFVAHLRALNISPNGHPHTVRRPLRDKGVQYILECCRSLYAFAARRRHLPPYAGNPFADLQLDRMRVEDAKPIFVFDEEAEMAFLRAAGAWAFPIHLTLAKTGLRPGELAHLLVEDLDLGGGWLYVRGKPELGWKVKTGRDRPVPMAAELVEVLGRVLGGRGAGPVFRRERFDPGTTRVSAMDRAALAELLRDRLAEEAGLLGRGLSRVEQARVARSVWRDAGAVAPDRIRTSFLRIAGAIGHSGATCPKSWRHTFATLLQDANVDPLIRQLTLGHRPSDPGAGALGMTGVYTHTRPETQRREILRALRTWARSLELARAWAQGGA